MSPFDRAMYFSRRWNSVLLTAPGLLRVESVNIDNSLFRSGSQGVCVSQMFGEWLANCGCAHWPVGAPPQAILLHYENNCFNLIDVVNCETGSPESEQRTGVALIPSEGTDPAQSSAWDTPLKFATG